MDLDEMIDGKVTCHPYRTKTVKSGCTTVILPRDVMSQLEQRLADAAGMQFKGNHTVYQIDQRGWPPVYFYFHDFVVIIGTDIENR